MGISHPEKSHLNSTTSKADDLIVTELSTLFDNCSIKELKINKSAVIQQLSAQIATTSYDINDFIDENLIEGISNSTEDLDATIMKAENYRTQFRSEHQEFRITLDNEYEERCQENLETKLGVIKEYIKEAKSARKNIRHEENLRKVDERSTKARSLEFSLRCIDNPLVSLTIEMAKSFEDVSDEEVTRRKNDKSNQIRLLEQLSKKIKDVLESLSQYPGKEKEVERIMRRFEELTKLKAN